MMIFAHRGYHDDKYLENSDLAIKNAIQDNAQAIEVDVQLTSDEQLILFHDYDLQRIYGQCLTIQNTTSDEIKSLTPLNHKQGSIISLEDFCAMMPINILINLELKSKKTFRIRKLVAKVYQVVQQFPNLNILISSFNPLILSYYRSLDKNARLALIIGKPTLGTIDILFIKWINPVAIHLSSQMASANRVKYFKQHGYLVNVYTINDQQSYQHFCNLGVDGIFSDVPELLKHK